MNDEIDMSCTPANEECYPVGHPKSRAETRIWRDQLAREFPKGIFWIRRNPHDFGAYWSVVAIMKDDDSTEAAWNAEGSASAAWDSVAIEQVKALGAM